MKAATNRSYHGGSLRGGYGHGLAADVVSIKGETRTQRFISSESLWKWIDVHGKEFGIGRPYLDKDPAHVAPIDGKEYAVTAGRIGSAHCWNSTSATCSLLARHMDWQNLRELQAHRVFDTHLTRITTGKMADSYKLELNRKGVPVTRI